MAEININSISTNNTSSTNVKSNGIEFFTESESFLDELSDSQSDYVLGGLAEFTGTWARGCAGTKPHFTDTWARTCGGN